MSDDPPVSLWPEPTALGPLTDLYQLTMMAGYVANGMDELPATFELFVRRLPKGRTYLVFAGLEQALRDLLGLAFSPGQIDALQRWPVFDAVDPSFFSWLGRLRFRGDVWAVPEGTVVFEGEPLVRVQAPLALAQWVETFLLASLGYPTSVASKAARIVAAAGGRSLYDFGARRAPGPHASLLAARAAYPAGFDGTSNVEASLRIGIPCAGTMAHSWVQSFDQEAQAFSAFAHLFPTASTMLVDTYDTARGVEHAGALDPPVRAVRLDSGDLLTLSRAARAFLDAHGRSAVRIFASGDLDEFQIARLLAGGAPIDAFGIGTELVTSRDAPALAMVYKLVELDGRGRIKLSSGKITYPRAKQVYRTFGPDGRIARDTVTLVDEAAEGEPLLEHVVRGGVLEPLPRLGEVRDRCRAQLESLPPELRGVEALSTFRPTYSQAVRAVAEELAKPYREATRAPDET
ncbi:MAG: nicotinate phosphoribosyltransferase [Isosphaeraceae bacterium]|nr:nicotinate phosphoribosyltransferase [Isosphaeraceae bacterium]